MSSVWHPFTQHGLGEEIPLVERAKGASLHLADGRTLIDCISSWWVTTHGHCEPRIAAAIGAQAQRLDQLIFAGHTHGPAEEVAASLIGMMPASLTRAFFSDSGSTAVEVALKMALGYWHRRGEPRHRILVLQHSYHGDTIGAMSVGERGVFNRRYEPLLFDVTSLPFPDEGREQTTLDALETAAKSADRPAALIVEPLILGAGGMLIYPVWVLKEMAAVCAEHDILFIADEVMTAWGRTGTLLACEQADVQPDILCMAKGLTGGALPLAATLASEAVFEAHLSQDRADMFYHSSSYTANPIACAAAAANIRIWQEENVLERIGEVGNAMARQLADLQDHPSFENNRQLGGIAALDLKVSDAGYLSSLAPALRAFFLEKGLLLRPLGNTIYLMPPYCISEDEIVRIFGLISEAGDRFGRPRGQ